MYQRPAHRPSACFLLSVRFKRKGAKTQSLYLSTMSFVFKHDVFCLQNRLRKFFRFSSLHGLFVAFSARFAAFSVPFHNVFCTENRPLWCRKALPAFTEQRFLRFFTTRFCPKNAPLSCRKGLPTPQRGRYCIATAAPLQCRKAPPAPP